MNYKILTRRPGLKPHLCNAGYSKLDVKVQSGLALTPAKVKELSERGIAVSTPAADSSVFDGSAEFGDYSMDSVYESGMTREELWERSQVAKKKIMSARNRLSRKQVESKQSKEK